MKLTNPEKLMLVMLAEIHEHLGIKNGTDTKFLADAIYEDQTWALSWEMQGIVGDTHDSDPPEINEVLDILDMWSFIEDGYASFDANEKKQIETEADPFGSHVRFSGFDGNNEAKHMRIAEFLVEKLERFTGFKGRDFNSHYPSLGSHRRMFSVFEPIRVTLVGRPLSVSEVIKLLKAKRADRS